VLEINEEALTSEIKYEAPAPVGDKETAEFGSDGDKVEKFPHLYGTIDFDAVLRELNVSRCDDMGTFLSIEF
jgi:uncharacterized protein (DUF952 family)